MANLTKKQREAIYAKYNGHCAYCGKKIDYKDMQVDHLIPQRRATYKAGRGRLPIEQVENFDNYMPSCRRDNHYKRAHNLETFRRYIEEIPIKLANLYIAKVGGDYGLIQYYPRKIKFYFEMTSEEREQFDKENDFEERTVTLGKPTIELFPIEESDIVKAGEFF